MSSFTIPTNNDHLGTSAVNTNEPSSSIHEGLNPHIISASPARKKRGSYFSRQVTFIR